MVLGEPSDICTDCGASPQDVRHMFACTTHPTDLSPKDLWQNPVGLICAFSYLDKNKLEELKLLIHDTHADITIQETKLTPKVKTPKVHNFTTVRNDRLHKIGGGLITLIRDNITFTTTDIP